MQQRTYQQFAKLSQDKQGQLVNQRKQEAPSPIPQMAAFPEIGFLNLTSTQDKNNIKLTTYRHQAQNTKGVVIFFHSMCYHIGIAGNLAKTLADNGYTVVGFDQRGHGKSEGQRGYLDDFKTILNDCNSFIGSIFKTYPNVPVFLMGHGLGSLLSIVINQQLKNYKFSGLILVAPALKKPSHNKMMSAISGFALKMMPNKAGLFAPQFNNVCRNPTAAQYLKKDPLVYHEKVFVGTLMQMTQMMQKNEDKNWSKLETPPIVLIQGQYDKAADPINSIRFYEAIKTKDKQLWWYPNMWNCFYFQPQFPQISSRIVEWLNNRTK